MKKNRLPNSLRIRRGYLGLCCILPLLVTTCREHEKRDQIAKLDNEISSLDKKIDDARDLRTANVPSNLRATQARYAMASDSLDKNLDTLETCIMNNEMLFSIAFNNYATRIGNDFKISKFLSKNDIAVFKTQVASLDTMEYIQEMARQRILKDNGSLNDLSYFFEMFDLDSVNQVLDNKLDWMFFDAETPDTNDIDVTGILTFENPELTNALKTEQNILNRAWGENALKSELGETDSLRMAELSVPNDSVMCDQINAKYDSVQRKTLDDFANKNVTENTPNFTIPEFDSIRTKYMKNDSLIRVYNKTFSDMMDAEDSLNQYRQKMIKTRDSLIEKRSELQK